MVFTVTTQAYAQTPIIYIYPGTMDAISLEDIQEGDTVVVVKNSTEKIYLSKSYMASLYSMVKTYGLAEHEVIDPTVPTPDSAIPVEDIEYYTAKMITPDLFVPNDAMVAHRV
jgi:hypothetical protein